MLNPSSSAASRCVITFFLAFFNVTSRSRSACVMSSCPSCIPKAWGCQEDISTLLKGDIITLLPHVSATHYGRTKTVGRPVLKAVKFRKQHVELVAIVEDMVPPADWLVIP